MSNVSNAIMQMSTPLKCFHKVSLGNETNSGAISGTRKRESPSMQKERSRSARMIGVSRLHAAPVAERRTEELPAFFGHRLELFRLGVARNNADEVPRVVTSALRFQQVNF